jgi:hypothetical protein
MSKLEQRSSHLFVCCLISKSSIANLTCPASRELNGTSVYGYLKFSKPGYVHVLCGQHSDIQTMLQIHMLATSL